MVRVIDFINDLWMMAGEPSDFDPWLAAADPYVDLPDTGYAINSRGVRYYLEQLSRAQTAISNWRKGRGHEVRFKKFFTNKNIIVGLKNNEFTVRPYGSFSVSIPASEFYPGATGVAVADYDIFEGALIEIDGEKYPIILSEYDATIGGGSIVFTFYDTVKFDTSVATYDGVLYMNQFRIKTDGISYDDGFYASVPPVLIEILKVYDGPSGDRVKRPPNKDSLYTGNPTVGKPSMWYVIGDRLYFDTFMDGSYFFQIEYYRSPTTLTASTLAELRALRFEVPEYFVEPLQLWVEWRQARMQQEWDKAYAIRRDMQEVIERLSTENSLDFMRDESYGFYVQGEENR